MAILYVSSVDGDNDSPPSVDWWNGKQDTYESVQGALTAATDADNTIYVDSDHDFVSTASIEWALPAGGSVRIISVDRVHGNLIPGARETIDGNNLYVKIGNTIGVFYIYGMHLDSTSGQNRYFQVGYTSNIDNTVDHILSFEKCTLQNRSTSANSPFRFGGVVGSSTGRNIITLRDCNLIVPSVYKYPAIFLRQCEMSCYNVTMSYSGVESTANLFSANDGWRSTLRVIDSDLSVFTGNIFSVSNSFRVGEFILQNCKLNPAVTLIDGDWDANAPQVSIINCDSGNTNTVFEYRKNNGTIVEDETVYYKGTKFADGSNISWAVVPNNKATVYNPFYTPWISMWNSTVDSAVTAKIKLLIEEYDHIKDTQLWVEFEYLADATSPQGTLYSSRNENPFTAETDLDNDYAGSDWETGDYTIPMEYILSHTFTPKRKGLIRARVGMLAAVGPININPKIELE